MKNLGYSLTNFQAKVLKNVYLSVNFRIMVLEFRAVEINKTLSLKALSTNADFSIICYCYEIGPFC